MDIEQKAIERLKEGGGKGRFITTGVRWAESTKRKNNRGIEEIADVWIMMEQLKMIYACEEELELVMAKKLLRLRRRMECEGKAWPL